MADSSATESHGGGSDSLIERLLGGPNNVELKPKELAFLKAYVARPLSLSQIRRERKATGRSPTQGQHNKLKLLLDFNLNLESVNTGGINESGTDVDKANNAKPEKGRMSRKGADVLCRQYLESNKKIILEDKWLPPLRTIAREVGCSTGLVPKLASYIAVKQRLEDLGINSTATKRPKAVSLTPKIEASVGRDDEELNRLISESEADDRSDPSPLIGHSDDQPKKVRQRKKL